MVIAATPTVILDYSHHPFIRRTAERLAADGRNVRYLYNASFGSPNKDGGLPDGEVVRGLAIPGTFKKEAWVKRWLQERTWTRDACNIIAAWKPGRVAVANAPLHVAVGVQAWCRRHGVPYVLWMQDINSRAVADIILKRIPLAGGLLSRQYERHEAVLVERSDRVIFISDGFLGYWQERCARIPPFTVLPNWSTLDDLPQHPRDNPWAQAKGLAAGPRLLYSGTIGRKHPIDLLRNVATVAGEVGGTFTVVSSGDWAEKLAQGAPPALRSLPFQPFSQVPQVLASSDVLVAVLGEEASSFSVPSKILTYLCAGRAILAVMPADNPSARLVSDSGAGLVVSPEDPAAVQAAVRSLLSDAPRREAMGKAARSYAERTFAPGPVAAKLWTALGFPDA